MTGHRVYRRAVEYGLNRTLSVVTGRVSINATRLFNHISFPAFPILPNLMTNIVRLGACLSAIWVYLWYISLCSTLHFNRWKPNSFRSVLCSLFYCKQRNSNVCLFMSTCCQQGLSSVTKIENAWHCWQLLAKLVTTL